MTSPFKCWRPYHEEIKDATLIEAADASKAAEQYASKFLEEDVYSMEVVVLDSDGRVHVETVTVSYQPNFSSSPSGLYQSIAEFEEDL